MLRRGASFSSAICSGFCKLDALFESDGSHAFRAAARSGVTCFKQLHAANPPRPLTSNHTAFDDVVNPPLEELLPLAVRAAATLSRRRKRQSKG